MPVPSGTFEEGPIWGFVGKLFQNNPEIEISDVSDWLDLLDPDKAIVTKRLSSALWAKDQTIDIATSGDTLLLEIDIEGTVAHHVYTQNIYPADGNGYVSIFDLTQVKAQKLFDDYNTTPTTGLVASNDIHYLAPSSSPGVTTYRVITSIEFDTEYTGTGYTDHDYAWGHWTAQYFTDGDEAQDYLDELTNSPPVLDTIGNKSVNELETLSFTATASDPDSDPLIFSLTGAPDGASITTGGDFSWTPTEAQGPGEYTCTIVVTEDTTAAKSDSETITITVNEVNVAPVLASIGNKSINELSELTFTASATDSDIPSNTLSFSLIGAPTGASINSSTGAFSWTPTETQGPSSYTFKVRVTDNGTPNLYDEEEIIVTVNEVAAPPVLAGVPTEVTIPELSLYNFTATATDVDIPADTLTFSLTGEPDGASINSSTGVFGWTPTEAQGPGEYTFTVGVNDGSLSDEQSIKIIVTEVNQNPVLSPIGSKVIEEHNELSFTAVATDDDLPPQKLTFSLIGAPAGATINEDTGEFSWTPSESQGPNVYNFTVKVTDSYGGYASEVITVTVTDTESLPPDPPAYGTVAYKEPTLSTLRVAAIDSSLEAYLLEEPLIRRWVISSSYVARRTQDLVSRLFTNRYPSTFDITTDSYIWTAPIYVTDTNTNNVIVNVGTSAITATRSYSDYEFFNAISPVWIPANYLTTNVRGLANVYGNQIYMRNLEMVVFNETVSSLDSTIPLTTSSMHDDSPIWFKKTVFYADKLPPDLQYGKVGPTFLEKTTSGFSIALDQIGEKEFRYRDINLLNSIIASGYATYDFQIQKVEYHQMNNELDNIIAPLGIQRILYESNLNLTNRFNTLLQLPLGVTEDEVEYGLGVDLGVIDVVTWNPSASLVVTGDITNIYIHNLPKEAYISEKLLPLSGSIFLSTIHTIEDNFLVSIDNVVHTNESMTFSEGRLDTGITTTGDVKLLAKYTNYSVTTSGGYITTIVPVTENISDDEYTVVLIKNVNSRDAEESDNIMSDVTKDANILVGRATWSSESHWFEDEDVTPMLSNKTLSFDEG